MEPPSDLHGAIYGTDDPLESPAAIMDRGPCVPSPLNPTPMTALPYPHSIVDHNSRPSPAQPHLPSEVYSNARPWSAVPQSASVISSGPRSQLAESYLHPQVYNDPGPQPATAYLPSEVYSTPRPPPAGPYPPLIFNSNPRSQPATPYQPSPGNSTPRPPPAMPWLPSAANIQQKPAPGLRVQDRTPVYHHHQIPHTSGLSTFDPPTGSVPMRDDVGPPIRNIIALPRRDGPATGSVVGLPRSDDVGSQIVSAVKDPLVCDQGLVPREKKQTETKKRKTATTNQTSTIRKKSKTPKARTKTIKHSPHDQDDVRNKEPEDWDQIYKIQHALVAVFRSFGVVTARPPPQPSPYRSYHHQRAVLQQASDQYWRMDRRPGQPPQLASLGAWHGSINSIMNAPVEITEEDLEPATHPSHLVKRSIAWLEQNHNRDSLLENQLQANALA